MIDDDELNCILTCANMNIQTALVAGCTPTTSVDPIARVVISPWLLKDIVEELKEKRFRLERLEK